MAQDALKVAQDALKVAQDDLVTANAKVDELEGDADSAAAQLAEIERVARAKKTAAALVMTTGTAPEVMVKSTSSGHGRSVMATGYAESTDETPPVRGEGWNGQTLVKSGASSTEQIRVYTNIQAPTDVRLVVAEGGMATDSEFKVDDVEKWGEARPLIGIVDFLKSQVAIGQGNTAMVGNEVTVSGATSWSFAGTYRGISGTYACTGVCAKILVTYTAAQDGEAEKVVLSQSDIVDWYFRPADLTDTVKVADSEYLHFGSWLETPDKPDGEYSYQVFAGAAAGSESSSDTLGRDVIGTATYEGPAAGMYVTKDLIADTAKAGEFTATTTLTANFGMEADGLLGANMIEGVVKDFLENGESLGSWSITLMPAAIDGGSWATADTNVMLGSASKLEAGEWSGIFYGNPSLAAVDAGTTGTPTPAQIKALAPTGVAGMFNANLDAAHIRGAYGATIR